MRKQTLIKAKHLSTALRKKDGLGTSPQVSDISPRTALLHSAPSQGTASLLLPRTQAQWMTQLIAHPGLEKSALILPHLFRKNTQKFLILQVLLEKKKKKVLSNRKRKK